MSEGFGSLFSLLVSIVIALAIAIGGSIEMNMNKDKLNENINSNTEVLKNTVSSYSKPNIAISDMHIKQGSSFNPLLYISVNDVYDGTSKNGVKSYGHVDTAKKGIYIIRFVVTNSKGMMTSAKVNVIVE